MNLEKLWHFVLKFLLYYALVLVTSYLLIDQMWVWFLILCLGVALLSHFKQFTWWVLPTNIFCCIGMQLFEYSRLSRNGITEGSSYAIAQAVLLGLLIFLTLATVCGYAISLFFKNKKNDSKT